MDTILLLASNEKFKLVAVQFAGNELKNYTYMTTEDLQPEDFVVIIAPDKTLKVVKVVEVIDPLTYTGFTPLKWIVQKVDLTQYEHLKKVESDVRSTLNTAVQRKRQQEYIGELKTAIGDEAVTKLTALVRL